ncbi:major facilitator superfamily domain-containing protein 6-like [Glandiceps talaboti]
MADGNPEAKTMTEDKELHELPADDTEKGATTEHKSKCKDCMRINTRLLPSKMFYFFFFGGIGALFPYLTIYFKQLGLDPLRIGLLSGIRPFIGFLSGPIWGAIADKYRKRRLLLMLSLCGWIGMLLAIGFIPPADQGPCPVSPALVKQYLEKENKTARSLYSASAPYRKSRSMGIVTHMTCGRCELPDIVTNVAEPDFEDEVIEKVGGTSVDLAKRELIDEETNIESTVAMMRNQEDSSWLYDPDSLEKVFLILMTLIIFGEITQSPTTALADTSTLDNLDENYDKYGNQRVWGAVGLGASSFAVGALINLTRETKVKCGISMVFSDYHVAFYCFAGLMAGALIVATQLKFKDHDKGEQSEHDLKYLLKLLSSVHFISILLVSFFMGICNGLVYGFLFWHLENLGASQLLMGTASIVIYGAEVIMFFLTYRIISVIGHICVLHLGLVCYAIRFLVYSQITNPWWVIPAEILQGITFAAVWTALTSYMALAVPSDSFATLQGILHGVYWGLGCGVGNMLGGLLVDIFGAVKTFASFSFAAAAVMIVFVIVQRVCDKPKGLKDGYDELEGDTSIGSGMGEKVALSTGDDALQKPKKSVSSMPPEVAAAQALPGADFN